MTTETKTSIMPGSIRVVLADDSAFMRNALRRMLEADPAFKIVGTGKNGQEAFDLCRQFQPDVLTLDVEMPVMDGLTALKKIMAEVPAPPAVLMCSSLTSAGSHEALAALRSGAADVIAKEGSMFSLNIDAMRDDLLAKIKAIAMTRRLRGSAPRPVRALPNPAAFKVDPRELDLVVIGASTGGPPVLETLVTALTPELHIPVVIAQHMPVLFTKSLAERLNTAANVPVQHAEHGMKMNAGTVYIAPGGLHTRVRGGPGRFTLEIGPEPTTALYRPSVNELFSSAAKVSGKRTLGFVCTGMGDDGMLGSRDLQAAGARVIAQDMPSCVVYGMPKSVAQGGYAAASMSPEEMAKVIGQASGKQSRSAA
jgi:two-component system chemotaxis response regulator CheB